MRRSEPRGVRQPTLKLPGMTSRGTRRHSGSEDRSPHGSSALKKETDVERRSGRRVGTWRPTAEGGWVADTPFGAAAVRGTTASAFDSAMPMSEAKSMATGSHDAPNEASASSSERRSAATATARARHWSRSLSSPGFLCVVAFLLHSGRGAVPSGSRHLRSFRPVRN